MGIPYFHSFWGKKSDKKCEQLKQEEGWGDVYTLSPCSMEQKKN